MKNKSQIYLDDNLIKFLDNIKSGTFFRKGSIEYYFNELILNEQSYERDGIIYPNILLKGKDIDNGKIIFDLKPYRIKNFSGTGLDKKVEKLKGTLEIESNNELYYSEGKINEYWNAYFKIDKDSIDTNFKEYLDREIFIFKIQ